MMQKFDVRRDLPVCAAAVVASFLVGLLCFFAVREGLGGRAMGEIGTKCIELASLPSQEENVRARVDEMVSEIGFLNAQVRDASRTGVRAAIVTGVGFLALALVAHFFLLSKEAGAASQAGEAGESGGRRT